MVRSSQPVQTGEKHDQPVPKPQAQGPARKIKEGKAMSFTVGELSRLTGVTVRALHHYDEIGLVRPSQRTTAGYRMYAEVDVLRLHQVLLFRELGLPLDEIAAAIEEEGSQEELLRRHREVLVTKR